MRVTFAPRRAPESVRLMASLTLCGVIGFTLAAPVLAPGSERARSAQTDWLQAFYFKYTIAGMGLNKPTQVFDDGVSTWIQFEDLNAKLTVLAERESTPLNSKREGDFVRLVGVYEQLVLHMKDEAYLITRNTSGLKEDALALTGANVNHFQRRFVGGGFNAAKQSVTQETPSTRFSTQDDSAREHAYATPVSGDTLRFEGSDRRAIRYRYGIDFLPNQSRLDAAALLRVKAFLRTLPKEARPQLLCAPETLGSESAVLSSAESDKTQVAQSALSPVSGPRGQKREAALEEQRSLYVMDLLNRAGLTGGDGKTDTAKRQMPRAAGLDQSRLTCHDTWVIEWREPLPTLWEAPMQVMLSDLTLLKTLQRWGELAGWRVVSTDAPQVPVVKEVSVSENSFLKGAQALIHLANQAGFAVRGTPHEGQVLLLSKGEGHE